jgi:hypothetical protein
MQQYPHDCRGSKKMLKIGIQQIVIKQIYDTIFFKNTHKSE